jgi:radical SAM protein with 4Fe4S-binding SPASM domain
MNFLQPQGRGADESQLLTGDEMFEGVRQILDHMVQTDIAVEEVETMMNVQRFLQGRDPRPPLSCWEYQCQAGRVYVAVDLLGRIHACGTDLSSHVLGHISQPIDDEHYRRTLERLHEKGDWVIRCFDCDARRICRHSCSTSDYNSETYKEHECRFTKLLYRHLCDYPQKSQRIAAVLRARRAPPPGTFVPLAELEAASAM